MGCFARRCLRTSLVILAVPTEDIEPNGVGETDFLFVSFAWDKLGAEAGLGARKRSGTNHLPCWAVTTGPVETLLLMHRLDVVKPIYITTYVKRDLPTAHAGERSLGRKASSSPLHLRVSSSQISLAWRLDFCNFLFCALGMRWQVGLGATWRYCTKGAADTRFGTF